MIYHEGLNVINFSELNDNSNENVHLFYLLKSLGYFSKNKGFDFCYKSVR
jgi:hypothetical protein